MVRRGRLARGFGTCALFIGGENLCWSWVDVYTLGHWMGRLGLHGCIEVTFSIFCHYQKEF